MKLTREHELYRLAVRATIDRLIAPHVDEWDAAAAMPTRELLSSLADEGLLGTTIGTDRGGLGLDLGYSYVWAQELGRLPTTAVAMSLLVQTEIVAPMLAELAQPEVAGSLLKAVLAGRAVGAIAVTEAAGGSDLAGIRTSGRQVGGDWVINGGKAFITHGSDADVVLTLCRTGDGDGIDGLTLIAVPVDLPGVRQQDCAAKFGNRACAFGAVAFEEVAVPASHVLGEPGLGYHAQTRAFARERCFWSVVLCAWGRRVLADLVRHLGHRQVLGRSLLDHESVRNGLSELDAELDLVEHYAGHAFQRLACGADCLRESTIAKLRAARLAQRAAGYAMQMRGAGAYFASSQAERDLRDAQALSLAGGADGALLHLLGGYLDPAGEPRPPQP
ncbi:MAG TPA: acyl-CoA dehydrogenase family protein [Rugosimonospora sp.]|nr:acyl-CoA dehydrogenase family protein [Rugosimonospora sp.]